MRDLRGAAPDPGTEHHLTAMVVGPVVLCEVDLATTSPVHRIVGAAQILTTWLRPDARFIITGPVVDLVEVDALLRWCVELNLTNIWIAADPTDGQLEAFRRRALVTFSIDDVPAEADAQVIAEAIAAALDEVAPAMPVGG
jgi:hypothetical protein